jgi:hypothetical protein
MYYVEYSYSTKKLVRAVLIDCSYLGIKHYLKFLYTAGMKNVEIIDNMG